MKQDNIVAFMAKNSKKFRESDYGTVRNTLASVDDSYFPLLMGKSFSMGWWIVLSIILWALGIFLAILGGVLIDAILGGACGAWAEWIFNLFFYDIRIYYTIGNFLDWSYNPGIIPGIFFCVLALLAIALGIYLLLMIRKKALKNLQKIATNLQQNEVTD